MLHICIGAGSDPRVEKTPKEFVAVLAVFSEASGMDDKIALHAKIRRSGVLELSSEAFVGKGLVYEVEQFPGLLALWLSGSPCASGGSGEDALLGDVEACS